MIRGALDASRAAGYMLIIGETGGDSREEKRITEALLDRQVDGIILASMFTQERLRPEVDITVPVVLANALPATGNWRAPAVVPDEREAGRAAAQRLLDAGHERIHLVGAGPAASDRPTRSVAATERLEGILETLEEHGLEPISMRGSTDWEPSDGFRIGEELLRDDVRGTVRGDAVIAFNDRLALGVLEAAREVPLSVPGDLSIISFDDEFMARHVRPALTTVALPHYEIGHLATDLLVRMITAPGGDASIHRIAMPLRERASIAAVPQR
jgi:LacI family transcriptional regulator